MAEIRAGWRASFVGLVATAAFAGPLAGVVAAEPKGRCDAGWLDGACELAKGTASRAKDTVTNAVSAPVEAAAGGVMDSLTRWVADAAVSLIGKVVNLMEETTDPRLGSDWFVERYELMMGLGLLILMPLLLIAAIRAIVRQDLGQLLRSFFVYLPIAIPATFVAIHLVQTLLAITDDMSAAVSSSVGNDATKFLEGGGGSVSSALAAAGGGFLIFFGALLIIVAGFLLWVELLIRSAGIYVCVFFLPLVLAGLVWPSTAKWTRRLIETIVALILSKFVIVSIISLAVAAIGDPGQGGVSTVIGGASLLLLASFSPFALFKLIPMGEMAAIGHLEGMERRPGRAMQSRGWSLQSMVKEKVAQGKGAQGAGAGMRAAGTGAGSAAAVGAGAALGATAAASAGKKVATAPGGRLDRQTSARESSRSSDGAKSKSSGSHSDRKAGGEIQAPRSKTSRASET